MTTLVDDDLIDEDEDGSLPSVIEPLTFEEAALAAIMLDPSGLDQAEFLLVDNSKPDLCYRAKPFQWIWWRDRSTRQFDQCSRDVGKALDVDTPVPTPEGWSTMGDLAPGDVIFDEQGRPTTVTEAFAALNNRECFEVVFDDHSTIVADGDHRWVTHSCLDAKATIRGQAGRPPLVRTTREIAETLMHGKERNHRIAVAGPVDLPEADLLIPPYTLGAWLGDGSSYRAHITAADDGEEILAQIEADGFIVKDLTSKHAYGILYPYPVNHKTGTVTAHLRRLGVRANKHIPPQYLRGSYEQRLALLQGLMDTDGHVTLQAGRCEITLKHEVLARGVFELAASLGQKPFWGKHQARCNGVDAGPVYRVGFFPNGIVPFRVSRKIAGLRAPARSSRSAARWIIDVRPVPSRPVRCIAVDSPSHQFLVGETFIATHNSERMMLRVLAFPFVHPREEMTIFTPEFSHIDKISERIEMRILTSWFYRAQTRPGRSGINHRPFKVLWANGARLISSLPQRSGIGAKGTHSVEVHCEEAQDLSHQAWQEIPNTISWEKPGASWHIHGVSKGVRDDFYDYSTKPELGFKVLRVTQMHREDWTEERRAQLIAEFGGSVDAPDYKRNVKGEHGDTANVIFILTKLMAGTDDEESSFFNQTEYTHFQCRGPEIESRVEAMGVSLEADPIEESSERYVLAMQQLLDFPPLHTERYNVFWAGMDVGLVDDPSEILVFADYHPDAAERRSNKAHKKAVPLDGMSRLKLVCRVSMRWIPAPLQADVIMWVIDNYKPRAFSMDSTGNGLPVFQELQKRAGMSRMQVMDYSDDTKVPVVANDARTRRRAQAREALTTIKGYNFSGKVICGFDQAKVEAMKAGATPQEVADEAGLTNWVKQAATDYLRGIVDTQRHWLPMDQELLRQWNAQTWQYGQGGVTAYGNRKTYSNVKVHTLDAARMMILGRELEPIEMFLREPPTVRRPVIDHFIEA